MSYCVPGAENAKVNKTINKAPYVIDNFGPRRMVVIVVIIVTTRAA